MWQVAQCRRFGHSATRRRGIRCQGLGDRLIHVAATGIDAGSIVSVGGRSIAMYRSMGFRRQDEWLYAMARYLYGSFCWILRVWVYDGTCPGSSSHAFSRTTNQSLGSDTVTGAEPSQGYESASGVVPYRLTNPTSPQPHPIFDPRRAAAVGRQNLVLAKIHDTRQKDDAPERRSSRHSSTSASSLPRSFLTLVSVEPLPSAESSDSEAVFRTVYFFF
jgi:hypothetical protein